MAIEKKSLISNTPVTMKGASKVNPAAPKVQTAFRTASAARFVSAIKLGKSSLITASRIR